MAFARLASLVEDDDPKQNPGRLEEAEFLARHSLKYDPANGQAHRVLETIKVLRNRSADSAR